MKAQRKRPAPGGAEKTEAAAKSQNRHEAERARKAARRGDRPGEDALAAAKQDWEQLRQRDVDTGQRVALVDAILARVMPTISELLMRHDASRVLQTVVKYATAEQRARLIEPVRVRMLDLARSHYGRFLALRVLKYASKAERSRLVAALRGHVAALLKHAEAAPVVEAAYAGATPAERQALLRELYGPEEALFGGPEPLAVRLAQHPERRAAVVKALRSSLNTLAEKQLMGGAIAQHLLADLFAHATPDEARDLVPSLAEQLTVLGATKDGARAAVGAVAYAAAKERKAMVKALKGHAAAVARHPHAHPILLALLRWMDDTVLLCKSVVAELLAAAKELAADQFALLSLLALLAPPSPAHFPRDLLDLMARYDAHSASKKEPAARQAELRAAAQGPLSALVRDEHAALLGSVRGAALVELVVAGEEAGEAKTALADRIAEGAVEGDAPLIETVAASRALKRMAKADPVARRALAEVLRERAAYWAARPGAGFVLLACVEAGDCPALVTALRPHAAALARRTEPAAALLAKAVKSAGK